MVTLNRLAHRSKSGEAGRPTPPPVVVPPGWSEVPSLLCPLCESPVHTRDGGGLWASVRCFCCAPATPAEGTR